MITYHEYEVFSALKLSSKGIICHEFEECRFENCEFEAMHLNNCKFIDCAFVGCCVINPVFDYCTMTGNDFLSCRLFGINWENLTNGFVGPINHLEKCQLRYNNFVNLSFPKFVFSGNEILDSLFGDCNLSHSKFSSCHLSRTEFFRCDLTGANFENADGYAVDISNCKLKGAIFSYPEVVNLLHNCGIIIK